MVYTLNLPNIIGQLYLIKIKEKIKEKQNTWRSKGSVLLISLMELTPWIYRTLEISKLLKSIQKKVW